MARTAALYVRISSDREGLELGVTRQEEDCRALATRLGLEQVTVFKDNDVSASTRSTKRRPAYDDMLRRTRDGEFSAIIAYSNSRLTRKPRETEDLIELAEKHRVRIHTVVSGQYNLDTADGRAIARTLAAWDAAEAERTAERVARAAKQRAKDGHYHGGTNPPFGYQVVREEGHRSRLIPEPEHVTLLREAADRLLSGDSLYGVCNDWEARGIHTRAGSHWRSKTLRNALLNRAILGETSAGVQGWEPVMDETTFNRVGQLLSDPSRMTFHATPETYGGKRTMGGGLTVCGLCGERLVSQMHRGRPRLICHKQATGGCGRVTVDHEHLEEYVFGKVLDAVNNNPRWNQRSGEPAEEDTTALEALEATRRDLAEQAQRANDAFIRGLMGKREHEAHVSRIQMDRDDVDRRITVLLGQNVVAAAIGDGLHWRSWGPLKRRKFLQQLVTRVEVDLWPDGLPTNLTARRGESDEVLEARKAENRQAALDLRVRIVPL